MDNFIFQNPVKAHYGPWDDCPVEQGDPVR